MLNINKISDNLKSTFLGKKILYYSTIGSTNTEAKIIASNENENGTLLIAETQTAGVGRQGKEWHSPEGVGVWMSVILKIDIETQEAVKISPLVGLSVRTAIEKVTGLKTYIKWPNDIIVNNKKVCGILVESILEGTKVKALVIGIGINVNQAEGYFGPELSHASSLLLQLGKKVSREKLIVDLLEDLEKRILNFVESKQLDIKEILETSIIYNKTINIHNGNEIITGKVAGFDNDGSIIILDLDNREICFKSGEVSIRGINGYLD